MKDKGSRPGDDFGMMREMLRRRFAPRCMREAPPTTAASRTRADLPPEAVEPLATPEARSSADDGLADEPGDFDDALALARPHPDRRRQGPARSRARRSLAELGVPVMFGPGAGAAGRGGGRHRQGAGPQRGPRDLLRRPGREPFKLARARSGALFRAAPARRGAPLRHRHPSGPRKKDFTRKPARRDRRHRAGPQARPAARLRHRQGDRAGQPRRSREGAGRQCRDGEARLRFLQRRDGGEPAEQARVAEAAVRQARQGLDDGELRRRHPRHGLDLGQLAASRSSVEAEAEAADQQRRSWCPGPAP